MLVLTRKVHQSILIRDDIVVEVLGVDRGRVKIGVSAPRDVTILREELLPPRGGGNPTNLPPEGESGSQPSS
jgi:carbon storage regulator CsrA